MVVEEKVPLVRRLLRFESEVVKEVDVEEVLKVMSPPTDNVVPTERAPVSTSPVVVREFVVRLVKLPVAPVKVPEIWAFPEDTIAPKEPVPLDVSDAEVTFPVPSTFHKAVVPLKT